MPRIPESQLTFRSTKMKSGNVVFPINKKNLTTNKMPPKKMPKAMKSKADKEVALTKELVEKYPALVSEKLTTGTRGGRRLKLQKGSVKKIKEILGDDFPEYEKLLKFRKERKDADKANQDAKPPEKAKEKAKEPVKYEKLTQAVPSGKPTIKKLGKKVEKKGTHKMPDGSTMKDSAMPKKDRKKAKPKQNAKTVPQKIARQQLISGRVAGPNSARVVPQFQRVKKKYSTRGKILPGTTMEYTEPVVPRDTASLGGKRPYLKRNVKVDGRGNARGAFMLYADHKTGKVFL